MIPIEEILKRYPPLPWTSDIYEKFRDDILLLQTLEDYIPIEDLKKLFDEVENNDNPKK